jgi:hypothetical protein
MSIREEKQKPSLGESSTPSTQINTLGKRSRESSAKDEDSQAKKVIHLIAPYVTAPFKH